MWRPLVLPLWGLALAEATLFLGFWLWEARLQGETVALALARAAARGEGASWVRDPQEPLARLGLEVVHLRLRGLRPEMEAWVPQGEGAVVARWPLRLWPPSLPLLALALPLPFLLWAGFALETGFRARFGESPKAMFGALSDARIALKALEEGLLLVRRGKIVLANDRGLAALGLPENAKLPLDLRRVWPQALEEGYLLLGRRPYRVRRLEAEDGILFVLQDQAELLRLAEELTQSRRYADLLRAQAHEFQNLLHTLAGLIELGREKEALELIYGGGFLRLALPEGLPPLIAALLVGKAKRAQELRVEVSVEGVFPQVLWPKAQVLALALGNYLENALEALAQAPHPRRLKVVFREEPGGFGLEVWDNGPGIPLGLKDPFAPGATGKGGGRGLGLHLVRAQVEALGGRVGWRREGDWTLFYAYLPEG